MHARRSRPCCESRRPSAERTRIRTRGTAPDAGRAARRIPARRCATAGREATSPLPRFSAEAGPENAPTAAGTAPAPSWQSPCIGPCRTTPRIDTTDRGCRSSRCPRRPAPPRRSGPSWGPRPLQRRTAAIPRNASRSDTSFNRCSVVQTVSMSGSRRVRMVSVRFPATMVRRDDAAAVGVKPDFVLCQMVERVGQDVLERRAAYHDLVGLVAGQLQKRPPGRMRIDVERIVVVWRIVVQPVQFIERDGRPVDRLSLKRGH